MDKGLEWWIEILRKNEELEVMGIEGGYVFVKDVNGRVFPVRENIILEWINMQKWGCRGESSWVKR